MSGVKTVLEELIQSRHEFCELVAMPSGKMPAAAGKMQIQSLESALKQPLPPSFQEFLMIQNGFPEIDSDNSIFSAEEMATFHRSSGKVRLQKIANSSKNKAVTSYFVLGISQENLSTLLFDPSKPDETGEWAVMEFDSDCGFETTHLNFLEFLKHQVTQYQEAAAEAKDGMDLAEMFNK